MSDKYIDVNIYDLVTRHGNFGQFSVLIFIDNSYFIKFHIKLDFLSFDCNSYSQDILLCIPFLK